MPETEFSAAKVKKLILHNRSLQGIWRKQGRAARLNETGALLAVFNAFILRDPVMLEQYQNTVV